MIKLKQMNRGAILYITLICGIATFASCKSMVTASDVIKQKNKSQKAVAKAQQELVELAQMKEKYSEDAAKAEIKSLKSQQKTIKKDIKKLGGLKGSTTVEATSGVLSQLKDKNEKISTQIDELENQPKENWQSSIEAIKRDSQVLQSQIDAITKNVSKK